MSQAAKQGAVTQKQGPGLLQCFGILDRTAGLLTVANGFLLLLIIVNVIRTLRHAMWRDEMQAFQIAVNSPSIWDLFGYLRYEAHPGLWYSLVWLVTRFTSDPLAMQILNVAIAIGVWIIIYRWSPFGTAEKILLILSYFLFWEYFVISRNYAIVALIGFTFVALRYQRPQQNFIPWVLLGLLANAQVYGAIWSVALAGTFIVRRRSLAPAFVAGGVAYAILLTFAFITAMPAPTWDVSQHIRPDFARFPYLMSIPLAAFVPINPSWVLEAFRFVAHPASAPIPHFWEPSPFQDFFAFAHGKAAVMFILVAPIAICWLISRSSLRTLEFAITYLGILLFSYLFKFPGSSRHNGVIFLALIACAWLSLFWRYRRSSLWLFRTLLTAGALGGILTLSSELLPFSEARNTAEWIKKNNFTDTFLIGSKDWILVPVTGYLGRPIFYLECECLGSFVDNTKQRRATLTSTELRERLLRSFEMFNRTGGILILSAPMTSEDARSLAPMLFLTLIKTFAGTSPAGENYWVYRVSGPP